MTWPSQRPGYRSPLGNSARSTESNSQIASTVSSGSRRGVRGHVASHRRAAGRAWTRREASSPHHRACRATAASALGRMRRHLQHPSSGSMLVTQMTTADKSGLKRAALHRSRTGDPQQVAPHVHWTIVSQRIRRKTAETPRESAPSSRWPEPLGGWRAVPSAPPDVNLQRPPLPLAVLSGEGKATGAACTRQTLLAALTAHPDRDAAAAGWRTRRSK
ncbi:uncharacterized protein BDZ99DRAFT_519719 [Mytilinidion resinicola]|uniref:Uncharacterized protein n=1 Tax=Mytilinidion resinicola TaxID=574789 RepID=A0A6A6YQ80_9PEZI|nr:uncharacterized protein BDZ99DRAFT_519719 [Mytilinidion resinicola]KAF2811052.1 hypothetical protein BDZ99DRAFT_519719 [Mytilinidion resinicola]